MISLLARFFSLPKPAQSPAPAPEPKPAKPAAKPAKPSPSPKIKASKYYQQTNKHTPNCSSRVIKPTDVILHHTS